MARRGLLRRVGAGVVFVPIFVLLTRTGGYAFLGFVDLFITLGLFEFYRMMSAKGMHPYRGIGIASGITLSTYMYFESGTYANFFLTFVLIAIMALELTRKDNRRAVYHVATTVLGIVGSFHDIGQQQGAGFDVVAPGLADALFATAVGLVAAASSVTSSVRSRKRTERVMPRSAGVSSISTVSPSCSAPRPSAFRPPRP